MNEISATFEQILWYLSFVLLRRWWSDPSAEVGNDESRAPGERRPYRQPSPVSSEAQREQAPSDTILVVRQPELARSQLRTSYVPWTGATAG